MLYNLDEITLIPAPMTEITSRKQCITYYEDDKLPLFISPMSCLINESNLNKFPRFNLIIPRHIEWLKRLNYIKQGYWVAVGLEEAKLLYGICRDSFENTIHICIDQANGHMQELLMTCRTLKKTFGRDGVKIITGNIANPETYAKYAACGIDYVRVSIGSGNACTTSCQTGFHYPMASLLIALNDKKNEIQKTLKKYMEQDIFSVPYIIADGGFKYNSQIIKALALGADYVMLGEIIAKSKEACGKTFGVWNSLTGEKEFDREYYGMSTFEAQTLINLNSGIPEKQSQPIRRSEGIGKRVPIQYSILEWKENFENDLKSAMSYNNSKTLIEFIGNVKWNTMSSDSYNKFMYKIKE